MIRKEMRYKGKFVLRAGKRGLRGMYFKEKWENDRGERGIEWTRALWEAKAFKTCKHAAAMANRLVDEDLPTWVVKVEDERKRIREREARRR